MIYEKSVKQPDGTILRRRELQTALPEWVQMGA